MVNCKEGHPILEDTGLCSHGHSAAGEQSASGATPSDAMAMMFQTMQLMHQTMQQMVPAHQPTHSFQHGRVKRPDRPTTKLSDPSEIRNELRSTCSLVINKLLFDFVGAHSLNMSTEEQLLTHIKPVAVNGVHKEVHHQRFHSLHQSVGESITYPVPRLTPCSSSLM